MKEFHFSKTYFNKTIFNDEASNIRVVVKETPSLEISKEDYSLRIETRHEDEKIIHRNYAIEHHLSQQKYAFPHIQFKFHTEEIGSFRIRLDFENSEEYKRAILGFIYRINIILMDLEKYRKGITEEILVVNLVNNLYKEGDFLAIKISESFSKYAIEFDKTKDVKNRVDKLKKNILLLDFLGKQNVSNLVELYDNSK